MGVLSAFLLFKSKASLPSGSIGFLTGFIFGFLIISLLTITNELIIYPGLIIASLMGGVAYKKSEVVFFYFMTAVASTMFVEGLSHFLEDSYPAFIESVQGFLDLDLEDDVPFFSFVIAYSAMIFVTFVIAVRHHLTKVVDDEETTPLKQ